jgi:hypothetical protein
MPPKLRENAPPVNKEFFTEGCAPVRPTFLLLVRFSDTVRSRLEKFRPLNGDGTQVTFVPDSAGPATGGVIGMFSDAGTDTASEVQPENGRYSAWVKAGRVDSDRPLSRISFSGTFRADGKLLSPSRRWRSPTIATPRFVLRRWTWISIVLTSISTKEALTCDADRFRTSYTPKSSESTIPSSAFQDVRTIV